MLLRLDGLDVARIDRYLDDGLLHYLGLLKDIGTRTRCADSGAADLSDLCEALHEKRIGTGVFGRMELTESSGLDEICAADCARQEQLFAQLRKGRAGVTVCAFDMVQQLTRLYGPRLDADQQLMIRDVYARMDEIVGKVLSLIDERSLLIVVIPSAADADRTATRRPACEIFTSRRLDAGHLEPMSLEEIVLSWLKTTPREFR